MLRIGRRQYHSLFAVQLTHIFTHSEKALYFVMYATDNLSFT